jgi:excinuclease UvrABC helicase subunit UvrB
LTDPLVEVRPIVEKGKYKGQIADFISEAEAVIKKGGRVIATTLTKKISEEVFHKDLERREDGAHYPVCCYGPQEIFAEQIHVRHLCLIIVH